MPAIIYSYEPEQLSWLVESTKYIEKERKIDSVSFYLSQYDDMFHCFRIDQRESLSWLRDEEKIKEILAGDKYYSDSIKNHIALMENDFCFIGEGGLGKTKQILHMYDQAKFAAKNKMLIFGKHLSSIKNESWFKDFILDEKNLLLFDAINEAPGEDFKSLIETKKCRMVATSRPNINISSENKIKIITLENKLSIYDFIEKYGKAKYLNLNFLPFFSEMTPREILLVLGTLGLSSGQRTSNSKTQPLSFFRDVYEQYLKQIAIDNKINSMKFWLLFKGEEGVIKLDHHFTKDEFLAIVKTFSLDENTIWEVVFKYNIIQNWNDKYIFSNDFFINVIKSMIVLNNANLGKTHLERIFNFVNSDLAFIGEFTTLIACEVIYRSFKDKKVDVSDILKLFSPYMTRLYTQSLKNRIRSQKFERKSRRALNKVNKNLYNKDRIKNLLISTYEMYSSPILKIILRKAKREPYRGFSSFTMINAICVCANLINITDRKRIMNKLISNHRDVGRLHVHSLIKNFKIKNWTIHNWEFDRKSFISEDEFWYLIFNEGIKKRNTKLFARYISNDWRSISVTKLRTLSVVHPDLCKRIVLKIIKNIKDYKLWYEICVSFGKNKPEYLKPTSKMIKNFNLREYSFASLERVANASQESELIDQIKGLPTKSNPRVSNTSFSNMCIELSSNFTWDEEIDNIDMENLLISKFGDGKNDFWWYADRICSIGWTKGDELTYPSRLINKSEIPRETDLSKVQRELVFKVEEIPKEIYVGKIIWKDKEIKISSTNNHNVMYIFVPPAEDRLDFSLNAKRERIIYFRNGFFKTTDVKFNFTVINEGRNFYRRNNLENKFEKFDNETRIWQEVSEIKI